MCDSHTSWREVRIITPWLQSEYHLLDTVKVEVMVQSSTVVHKPHCSNRDSEGMTQSVTWDTVLCKCRHGRDGCSATTSSQKPFPFLNASRSANIWQDVPTPSNRSSMQQHTGFDTHETVPRGWGMGGRAEVDNYWWNMPSHSLQHHPPIKTPPSFSLFTHTQYALAWGYSAIVHTSLFIYCVVGMLSVGTLAEAHIIDCE